VIGAHQMFKEARSNFRPVLSESMTLWLTTCQTLWTSQSP